MVRWPLLAVILLGATAFLVADTAAPLVKDSLPKNLSTDRLPLGLGPPPANKDNPITPARIALGRRLFFDPILSGDKTVACASCHQPEHGFASPGGKPRGIRGQQLERRAPTLFNRAYGKAFFWDGRTGSLEDQALEPIANPLEMGSTVADAVKRLQADAGYQAKFKAAFDDGVTAQNLARALASFERVLLRGDSRIDRFRYKGEREGLTADERHGLWLYESKGGCWRCHSGSNFSDEQFHNTGVGWGTEPLDLGRYAATKQDIDRGRFKTPTLRGVALTGPYMHDGSMKTLEDVVDFYSRGGGVNPHLDTAVQPLNFSPDERRTLVAFLNAL